MSKKTPAKTGHARSTAPASSADLPTRPAGPGRPPSQIRARARGMFDERLPILAQIADGEVEITLIPTCEKCGHRPEGEQVKLPVRTATADIAKAMDILAKYGLGPAAQSSIPVSDMRQFVSSIYDVIFRHVPQDQARSIAEDIAREVDKLDAPE